MKYSPPSMIVCPDCKGTGEGKPKSDWEGDICKKCLADGHLYHCRVCGYQTKSSFNYREKSKNKCQPTCKAHNKQDTESWFVEKDKKNKKEIGQLDLFESVGM